MKKSFLTIALTVIIVVAIIVWLFVKKSTLMNTDIIQIPILIIIIGFGLFVSISRFKSEKKGQPAEDELSKKLLTKASSISFYGSLYYLLILMYIGDKTGFENHSLMGLGIIGMAVLFVISWLYFRIRGLKDDE